MTLTSKIAIFSIERGEKALIAPPGSKLTPVKMYEKQAYMTLMDGFTRRSINPSLEATRL
jgi:hypothetical protein